MNENKTNFKDMSYLEFLEQVMDLKLSKEQKVLMNLFDELKNDNTKNQEINPYTYHLNGKYSAIKSINDYALFPFFLILCKNR